MADPSTIRNASLRVVVRPAVSSPDIRDPRKAFWQPLQVYEKWSNAPIEALEQLVVTRLGAELQTRLAQNAIDRISGIRFEVFGRELDHYLHFPEPRSVLQGEVARLLESRDAKLFDLPEYRQLVRRLTLASTLSFGVRIESYSSLELSLAVNRFKGLLEFFDTNALLIGPLLTPFLAAAFGEVFNDADLAQQFSWAVEAPAHVEPDPPEPEPSKPSAPEAKAKGVSDQAARAQWLWMIANGSLLVPVLLTLAVAYYAVLEMRASRKADYELLQPILQHHLELQKDDRERQKTLLELLVKGAHAGEAESPKKTAASPSP